MERKEIRDHHSVLEAIKGISAIEELVEFEPGHGFKYGVDIEVSIYGRNYGPGKKVGPYIKMFDYPAGLEVVQQGDWDTNTFFIVVAGAAEVFVGTNPEPVAVVKPGSPFGEMGVLAGVPRAATVKAHRESGAKLLEVQRPALRILRKLKRFGTALDLTYRRNGLKSTLTNLIAGDDLKAKLSDIAEYRVMARGHFLCSEGSPIDRIYIIRDGWIKRSASTTGGEGSDYLGPGYCLGLNALSFPNARWPYKALVLSRTEAMEIPLAKLRENPALVEALKKEFDLFGNVGTPLQPTTGLAVTPEAKQAQQSILDKGLADANNLLIMDMDLCVRCGNCSLACHNMHGQSRLTRRGIHFLRPKKPTVPKLEQSMLAPAVCLHCKDPECLTGCPTGAIARFPGGQVDIIPNLCIGCGDCATQCPYNSISLIPRKELRKDGPAAKPQPAKAPARDGKDAKGAPPPAANGWNLNRVLDTLGLRYDPRPKPVTAEEDLVAIKCNLCNNTPLNPTDKAGNPLYKNHKYNCEESCPTGALMRVTPTEYFSEIAAIRGKAIRRDGSTVIGGGIGAVDRGKQVMHLLGILATLGLCSLTMAGIASYGLGTPLLGSNWFNFRWLTGIVGLLGIVIVMLYPVRRQMWRKRSQPLRYWMLSHTYAGVIAGILLLLHGGTNLGGFITGALMISFDLVILTGLFGILIYQLGPRTLTKIEGEPLLIDDLVRRRLELLQEVADATETARAGAEKAGRSADFDRTFIPARDRVLGNILSLRFLFRQYLKKETLDDLVAESRKTFAAEAAKLTDKVEQQAFDRLLEAAVTARRIDALVYVHRALKVWLPPHVISTSAMLALLVVHIVQVIYYMWR